MVLDIGKLKNKNKRKELFIFNLIVCFYSNNIEGCLTGSCRRVITAKFLKGTGCGIWIEGKKNLRFLKSGWIYNHRL